METVGKESNRVRVVRWWRLEPRMTVALVADPERGVGVLQACPVGTRFWTLEQAEQLASESRTGSIMREAALLGRALLQGRVNDVQAAAECTRAQEVFAAPAGSQRSHRQAVVRAEVGKSTSAVSSW